VLNVKLPVATVCISGLLCGCVLQADSPPLTQSTPDLSGYYDVATLTPLQRPRAFGNKHTISRAEADEIAETERLLQLAGEKQSDPDREAPPEGGDGSEGAAGNVGGYNTFWIDRGDDTFEIDGKFRTSIIHTPENGRIPGMTAPAQKKLMARRASYRTNTGEAWWLQTGTTGPYDDPELRPLGERCLMGFGSSAGPPMLPVLYNNVKRIVQTPEYVMILVEMVHDARIIRLNSTHAPTSIRSYLGDSIGHWEGDTLVVDTTNFNARPALYNATASLHVVERFTRTEGGSLLYSFMVDDPAVWDAPWGGEYPWPVTDNVVYEYACHEGNYALGNILRGARLLEADTRAEVREEMRTGAGK